MGGGKTLSTVLLFSSIMYTSKETHTQSKKTQAYSQKDTYVCQKKHQKKNHIYDKRDPYAIDPYSYQIFGRKRKDLKSGLIKNTEFEINLSFCFLLRFDMDRGEVWGGYIHVHKKTDTYTFTYIYMYICTHICIHTFTYIYVYLSDLINGPSFFVHQSLDFRGVGPPPHPRNQRVELF